MKYLKYFEQLSDYEVYMTGGGVDIPNISYIGADGTTYYNPLQSYTIKYITADGKITTFDKKAKFYGDENNSVELPIISHTYSETGTIVFANPIVSIAYAFSNNIAYIRLPQTLKTLGDSSIRACHQLVNTIIPASVTTIGNNVFTGCGSLKKLIIPENVKSIGSYFLDFTNTTLVMKPIAPPTAPDDLFDEYSGDIYVPDASLEAYKSATGWSKKTYSIKPMSEYSE